MQSIFHTCSQHVNKSHNSLLEFVYFKFSLNVVIFSHLDTQHGVKELALCVTQPDNIHNINQKHICLNNRGHSNNWKPLLTGISAFSNKGTGGSRIAFLRGAVKLVKKTGVQGAGPLAGVARGQSPLA